MDSVVQSTMFSVICKVGPVGQGDCANSMGVEKIGLSAEQNDQDKEFYVTSKMVCGETSEQECVGRGR